MSFFLHFSNPCSLRADPLHRVQLCGPFRSGRLNALAASALFTFNLVEAVCVFTNNGVALRVSYNRAPISTCDGPLSKRKKIQSTEE